MGSWHVYCAVCGGPFKEIAFSKLRKGSRSQSEEGQEGSQEGSETQDEPGDGSQSQNKLEDGSQSRIQQEEEDGDEGDKGDDDDDDDDGNEADDDDDSDFDPSDDDSDILMGEDDSNQGEQQQTFYGDIQLSEDDDDETTHQNYDEMEVNTENELLLAEGEVQGLIQDMNEIPDPDTAEDINEQDEYGYLTESSDGDGGTWAHPDEMSYDSEVIRPKDTKWKGILYVLGWNWWAPGETKLFLQRCFLSGRGHSIEYGCADFWPGLRGQRDPNYPRETNGKRMPVEWAPLYEGRDDSRSEEASFPVHMPCLELLCGYLTGKPSPYENEGLDKDGLYLAFSKLTVESFPRSLGIGYGDAKGGQEQYWVSERGKEYLVANPRVNIDHGGVLMRVKKVVEENSSGGEGRRFVKEDLIGKVKKDPWEKTHYDVVVGVCKWLDDKSLMNLCRASWYVHRLLREDNNFWRRRLKMVSMPWFEEVMPWLEGDDETTDWKGVLCELNGCLAVGDEGKRGVLMGVRNRRRIWGCFKEIGREYFEMVERKKVEEIEGLFKELKGDKKMYD
ncbi:hypothetical protein QBC38DRAFT_100495 [Podospora fimiseda]|uniref:F-box domain-containing protein n=1 Tax=Podospora fimiseda TaxID=252190 RepID=A0AAN6YN42_9PEZI|nr:hypothetical protein QBC38DRAFT_100495 [Podospora fimiseda]